MLHDDAIISVNGPDDPGTNVRIGWWPRWPRLHRLHALLNTKWDAAQERDALGHYKVVNVVFGIHDRLVRLFGLDRLGPLGEEDGASERGRHIGPQEQVLGLTEDEYWDAIEAVCDRQRAEDLVEDATVVQDAC